ncbi:unnamed protein product [Microthlaspi erraticum]|uniref:Uncharacterized protein n=1 Tax=Microthlaspi erraticum TaxID=1685480 RepID=A0A6D2KM96_9BRAS|nr:unnamed protein product [Microthlaspi erraticum]
MESSLSRRPPMIMLTCRFGGGGRSSWSSRFLFSGGASGFPGIFLRAGLSSALLLTVQIWWSRREAFSLGSIAVHRRDFSSMVHADKVADEVCSFQWRGQFSVEFAESFGVVIISERSGVLWHRDRCCVLLLGLVVGCRKRCEE